MESLMPYAGFWRRALALMIDIIIIAGSIFLFAIPQLTSQILIHMRGKGMGFNETIENARQEVAYLMDSLLLDDSFNPQMFTLGLIWMTIFTILFALLESSQWQATPGKKIVGIKVCNLEGERLDFAQSFLRNFNKIFSMIPLDLGFFLAGLTRKRQALHDIMAKCLVVKGSCSSQQQF